MMINGTMKWASNGNYGYQTQTKCNADSRTYDKLRQPSPRTPTIFVENRSIAICSYSYFLITEKSIDYN